MSAKKSSTYSWAEERWNIRSHAVGLFLSLAGVIALMVKSVHIGSIMAGIAFLVYGVGVSTMFLASTLYHSAKDPVKRQRLQVFDHTAIYLTIAGSYTPISLLNLPSVWGIPILITVWLIAFTGITLKFFFLGSSPKLSTVMYVLMGWVIVVAIQPLIHSMETNGLIWLAAGGLAYTAGALLYQLEKIRYNHAIFHLFVLVGAICHYIVIYQYTIRPV